MATTPAVEWRQSHLESIFSSQNGGDDDEAAVWQAGRHVRDGTDVIRAYNTSSVKGSLGLMRNFHSL